MSVGVTGIGNGTRPAADVVTDDTLVETLPCVDNDPGAREDPIDEEHDELDDQLDDNEIEVDEELDEDVEIPWTFSSAGGNVKRVNKVSITRPFGAVIREATQRPRASLLNSNSTGQSIVHRRVHMAHLSSPWCALSTGLPF